MSQSRLLKILWMNLSGLLEPQQVQSTPAMTSFRVTVETSCLRSFLQFILSAPRLLQRVLWLFILPLMILGRSTKFAQSRLRPAIHLGASPYTYVHKNASFTHTTSKALCLFRSNPFLGAGPLYESLHKQYQLGPNEAFINQRFDTVNKFWVFFCETDYTLSADIVRFSHAAHTSTTAQSKPQRTISPSKPTGRAVTVVAPGVVEVTCHNKASITGRPNPTTEKSTVRFDLANPTSCQIKIEDHELQTVLSPGDSRLCYLDNATVNCSNVGSSQ